MNNENTADIPEFAADIITRLRRRRFPLGVEEVQALRLALRAGFGWATDTPPEFSPDALKELCCALWAKSLQERETLQAVFDEALYEKRLDWRIPIADATGEDAAEAARPERETPPETPPAALDLSPEFRQEAPPQETQGLPRIDWAGIKTPPRSFSVTPQFQPGAREIVQAWRRLRRPVREGPKRELDLEATIQQRSHNAVPTPVVLVPPRRNRSRLLLLVDRDGSMTPFHQQVEQFCAAVRQAGRLEQVRTCYFHDAPLEGAGESALEPLAAQLFPRLDPVLAQIEPLRQGNLYCDPAMLEPVAMTDLLAQDARGADVAIVSDGGAARRRYDLLRLLDTVAALKALREATHRIVWLNPLPERYWRNSRNSAGQIARHLPMFPLDRYGLHRAVDVLHGRPCAVECPF